MTEDGEPASGRFDIGLNVIGLTSGSSLFVFLSFTVLAYRFPMLRKFRSFCLTILVGSIAATDPTAAEELVGNDVIMRNFNIVAFGNEYTLKRYDHVRKWNGPIRIGIIGNPPPYFEQFVRDHIRDLWKLTGFPIELRFSNAIHKNGNLAKDFDNSEINFPLFFIEAARMPAVVERMLHGKITKREVANMQAISTCHARYWTKDNEIVLAYAAFPAEHPEDYLRACVIEEITQVLGLVNDNSSVNPSIFNDTSQHLELTEHDKWMVRMFYDPRITPGMRRQDAMRIGWEILREIRPEAE